MLDHAWQATRAPLGDLDTKISNQICKPLKATQQMNFGITWPPVATPAEHTELVI